MKISVVTLFPELIQPYMNGSILGRAQTKGLLSVAYINPRDFTTDKHHKADDVPYGGGPGMVMKAEPLLAAIDAARVSNPGAQIVYLEPAGKLFTNTIAATIAKKNKGLIFICGRYEGIDERVKKAAKGVSYSIGSYVLAGGELAAAVITEAVARQLPGVLGASESVEEKRHGVGVPSYTRPDSFEYKGKKFKVPKVLTEGHHAKIDAWRKKNSH